MSSSGPMNASGPSGAAGSRPAAGGTDGDRLRAIIGEARLQALLSAYPSPGGAVLPLAVLLRDAGVPLDAGVVAWLSALCAMTPVQVAAVVSAFPSLDVAPGSVTVCDGLSCRLMGAATVRRHLREHLGAERVCSSPCQNACSSAPVLHIDGILYGALHQEALAALADRLAALPERR